MVPAYEKQFLPLLSIKCIFHLKNHLSGSLTESHSEKNPGHHSEFFTGRLVSRDKASQRRFNWTSFQLACYSCYTIRPLDFSLGISVYSWRSSFQRTNWMIKCPATQLKHIVWLDRVDSWCSIGCPWLHENSPKPVCLRSHTSTSGTLPSERPALGPRVQ